MRWFTLLRWWTDMAGNSVPAFFNAKTSIIGSAAVDVTFVLDLSDSTDPYPQWIPTVVLTMERVFRSMVGFGGARLKPNRYSFATGGGSGSNFTTLNQIERLVTIDGAVQRWATGQQILDDAVTFPSLTADEGTNTQDMGLATNLIESTDRGYLPGNDRLIIAISDAQGYGTAFNAAPLFPHKYIGLHSADVAATGSSWPPLFNPNTNEFLQAILHTVVTKSAGDDYSHIGLGAVLDFPEINLYFWESYYPDLAFLNPFSIPSQQYPFPAPSAVSATAADGTLQINLDRGLTPNKGAISDLRALETYINAPEALGFQLTYIYIEAVVRSF